MSWFKNKNKAKSDSPVIEEIIETGAEVGGGVGGAIIGGLLAGPPGAIIGGASGPILTKLFSKAGNEIKKRILGDREQSRIGYTYAVGYQKINERLERGDSLRQDDFFDDDETNRSTAEEIFEGVIRSAQNEYEEKKLKYYGILLANIAFNQKVTKGKALFFLKIAQNLSYRQLCLLQFFSINDSLKLQWGYHLQSEELIEFSHLEANIEDLDKGKLVNILRTSGNTISQLSISKLGLELIELMELSEIDLDNINKIESEFTEIKTRIDKKKKG